MMGKMTKKTLRAIFFRNFQVFKNLSLNNLIESIFKELKKFS